jgi:hypothetical protein
MGFSFIEAFVLPRIATTAPSYVQAWMGVFTGPKGKFDLGVLPTIWTLTAPVYILDGLFFGVATFRAAILPRWAGALLVRWDRASSNRRTAPERIPAENGHPGRRGSRVARLCALV